MPKVDVVSVAGHDPAAGRIEEKLNQARSAIGERAFHVAQERAHRGGADLENWVAAERQLFHVPSCELVEQNGELRLRAAVPGFEASQLRLTALPTAIIIQSSPVSGDRSTNGADAKVHFTEFNRNVVLRRVELPEEIRIDSVTAKIERGVLEVVALKQGAVAKPPAAKKAAPVKRKAAAAGAGSPAAAAPVKPKSTARRKKTS